MEGPGGGGGGEAQGVADPKMCVLKYVCPNTLPPKCRFVRWRPGTSTTGRASPTSHRAAKSVNKVGQCCDHIFRRFSN
jgi:hypothetical protein